MLVLVEGGLGKNKEVNQTKLNPQVMSGTGVKPRPRRWEVSALPSGTVSYLSL